MFKRADTMIVRHNIISLDRGDAPEGKTIRLAIAMHTTHTPAITGKPLQRVLEGLPVPTYTKLSTDELRSKIAVSSVQILAMIETGRAPKDEFRAEFWYLNNEATRRNIPPSLRSLSFLTDDTDQVTDLISVDLEWLVAKYPDHKTLYPSWEAIWKPKSFHNKAWWIASHYPRKPEYEFCRRLALTEEQQREMYTLRKNCYGRIDDLRDKIEQTRFTIKYHVHRRPKRHQSDDPEGTVQRRLDCWFIGSIFGWKPQRLATLMTAYTGTPIERWTAARIVEQVHRDLPDSKPRRRRGKQ